MSRTSKGPRLYKRAARRKNGAIVKHAVWVILDGRKEISTGVAASPADSKAPKAAIEFLTDYLVKQHRPERKARELEQIPIADVRQSISTTVDPNEPEEDLTAQERHLVQTISRLNAYWGDKMLTDINTKEGKGYVQHRAEKNLEKAIGQRKSTLRSRDESQT